jgi:hypothetical protein
MQHSPPARLRLRPVLCAALAWLLAGAVGAPALRAQGRDIDILRGRIVTTDSSPIANANVRVTSMATQAVRRIRTDDKGRFSILFQNGGGDYLVNVTAIGVAPVEFRLRREGGEEILLANLTMRRLQMLDAVTVTEGPRPTSDRGNGDVGGQSATLGGTVLSADAQNDLNQLVAAMAGFQPVFNADGTIAGFSALGLDPSQNSFTLNGMQTSNSSLPRDADVVSKVSTSTFDASVGKFSGAQVATYARSGGPIRKNSVRLTLDDPTLQVQDRATASLSRQSRNIQLSGNSSGEIIPDKLNYNTSWQLGRRTSPLSSLLDADSSGLSRLGLTTDSVARYESVLRALGIPVRVGGIPSERLNQSLSTQGQIEYTPSGGGTMSASFNIGVRKNEANGISTRSVPAFGNNSEGMNSNVSLNWTHNLGSRFLHEMQFGAEIDRNQSSPYLTLPSASVLLTSRDATGGTSLTSLQFGNSGQRTNNTEGQIELNNTLSLFSGNSKHRLKLTTNTGLEWYDDLQAGNAFGTLSYNSLADLEAGRPASFVRRVGEQRRQGHAINSSASLTDTWRATTKLQFQLGLRADAVAFGKRPTYNPEIEQLFGLRTDRAPNVMVVSPRLGFTLNVGKSPASVPTQFGPGVLGTLSGGIGRFSGTPSASALAGAIDQTGLPTGAQQLTCYGPAVPLVDWNAILTNSSAIPTACADGTTATSYSTAAPRVTTFAPGWQPNSSWRMNAGWNGYLTDRFRFNAAVTYSMNDHQGASLDRNFDNTPRFTTDGGRPVFVPASAIDPVTGATSFAASRVSNRYAQVSANMGDGASRSLNFNLSLSPQVKRVRLNPTSWSVSYSTVRVRDKVRGFGGSTTGDPTRFEWARGNGDIAHQINVNVSKGFGTFMTLNLSGRAQSGATMTPMVGSDINGDGGSNDRAYIFDPAATPDSAVKAGMQSLLAHATPRARDCLVSQLGKLAGRNSCRGPWTFGFNASIAYLPPRGTTLGDRARITFNLANPLSGLDALVHGGRMVGWGSPGAPDPVLLYVRGFDPATQKFKYEVNQRFGETRAARSLPQDPFRATLDVRFTLGTPLDRQQASIELRGYRRAGAPPPTVESIKQKNAANVASVLRQLVQQKDSLQLTPEQVTGVATITAKLLKQVDSLWTPTATYILKLGTAPADDELVRRMRDTRAATQDAQFEAYRAVRALITPAQKAKLKPPFSYMIEEDYMKAMKVMGQMAPGNGN